MSFLRRLLERLTYPLRALVQAPGRLLLGSQRLLSLSLPARVAILTAIFLVVCVIFVVVAYHWMPERSYLRAKLNWEFYLVVGLLVIVIPIVLYKALKLWLEGNVSPFPDIDHAWKAGLAELERQGLDLSQTPLFLVLGTASDQQEKALFEAARLNLNVQDTPQGPAALHWYANPDGIYVVCSDTSVSSGLAQLAGEEGDGRSRQAAMPVAPAGGAARGTIVAGGPQPGESPTGSGPFPAGGDPDDYEPASDVRGTMIAGAHSPAADAAAQRRVVRQPSDDISEQQRRLQHVCRLIRRARVPLAPINGVLTLLPFGLIQRSAPEAIEVQRAVHRDIEVLLRTLKIRCPVTAMVVGLESEPGFRELVRRVGRDRALGQRFGRGFSVSNPPIPERLEALSSHACGSFEDWVYTLFREKDSLSKPGNTALYELLCKIRRNVQTRLANVLASAYAAEPAADGRTETLLFGGCYFAATGTTEDRQAFVKGVFDKLPEQQEELEWTDAAYREDGRFQRVAQLGFVLDGALLLGLAFLILNRWWPFWK